MRISRRTFLRNIGAASLALPFFELALAGRAHAMDGTARRLIVFYFPDGVAGASQNGDASLWRCTGSEYDFSLSETLQGLAPYRDQCVFINGLSMGSTDTGSHPGGAKKLLTGVDGGMGESIDQYLARTVGASSPWRHLYLGAMANHNGASGDKHISYPAAGASTPPEDNPLIAFERLFSGGGRPDVVVDNTALERRLSVIDTVRQDLDDLRTMLDAADQTRLDLHIEGLREVESRVRNEIDFVEPPPESSCATPFLNVDGFESSELYEPGRFPAMLRMQIDNAILAAQCGLTKVAVIQGSHHTSELIMSRFEDSGMYDPGYDMRSHQASHYGASHDRGHREFSSFLEQRKWWVDQFAYLLGRLRDTPEDDGTMLDHSLVLLCTEVSDGNTHSHDDMPFIVAGGAGGRVSGGRLLNFEYRRHSDLLVALANAMGEGLSQFGQASSGPLPGLLS